MSAGNAPDGPTAGREWPSAGLDVHARVAAGWRPTPFREFILKIHGHCNLACDYCYVYEFADQSWKGRPKRMSDTTLRRTAERIARHAEAHRLDSVDVVLHGGEPLLAGAEWIDRAVTTLRTALPGGCTMKVFLQTNGTLLTERMLDILAAHGVGVAVSIDGDEVAHDRHRRFAHGGGSHTLVERALRMLTADARGLFRGLLCTVDLANDPLRTYDALLESDPPRIDFLLPHGSRVAPPPGLPVPADGRTPYADWLIAIFDRWYNAPHRETGIRLFEEIINGVLGGQSESENIGLAPVAMVVIDTDGSLQQVDTLKTSFAGAPETGLSVFAHDFDEALCHPGVVARQIGIEALCDTCKGCEVRDICGGGAYAHRYRPGTGYLNPSVYCADLKRLIAHIVHEVHRDLAELKAREPSALG